MRVVSRGLVIALAAVFAAAAVASAAMPRAGATYKGVIAYEGTPGRTGLKLKVSATGKSLKAIVDCFDSGLVMKNVRIDDQGRFSAATGFGTAPGTIEGRFVTRRKAKGTLSTTACFLNGFTDFAVTR